MQESKYLSRFTRKEGGWARQAGCESIRDGEIVREFDIDEASERALADAERVGFADQE